MTSHCIYMYIHIFTSLQATSVEVDMQTSTEIEVFNLNSTGNRHSGGGRSSSGARSSTGNRSSNRHSNGSVVKDQAESGRPKWVAHNMVNSWTLDTCIIWRWSTFGSGIGLSHVWCEAITCSSFSQHVLSVWKWIANFMLIFWGLSFIVEAI